MKRALLVGIDHYDNFSSLAGCVNDVEALAPLLARHEDGNPNFDCRAFVDPPGRTTRDLFLQALEELFKSGADAALLYFAGHGTNVRDDLALATADGTQQSPGVELAHVLGICQRSGIRQVTIILDCCFAGAAGAVTQLGSTAALLREGVSILTASREDQTSAEDPAGRGIFSTYLCDALEGGAADIRGQVTVGGIYAYLDESFGPWGQRPMFKANVERLHEVRRCIPPVPVDELRRLPEFFPDPFGDFPLDPSYEPEAAPAEPGHEALFAVLQRYRAIHLVEPVGEDHLYWAAIHSKSCRLTHSGRHYRRVAEQNRL